MTEKKASAAAAPKEKQAEQKVQLKYEINDSILYSGSSELLDYSQYSGG